ncbi:MAG: crossover junction endodeoxyribonuclease RuvC [Bacteroidales bacterium]|nr:crossover junction endodeoxyribonuclease RuvC [Bacteroidales bacterium]MCR5550790.1 crossover junction endodeoxyribonuclease RuvC [Bacteroidales bacterium]
MMEEKTEHRILGIDPGTTVMGYSVLHTNLNKSDVEVISVIQMKKLPDQYAKLKYIYEKTNALIEQYHPDILSIEAPFYGNNVQSMLKLGRAQGVVIAACLHAEMEVYEYSPRKIKQSITGNGNAAKEQVAAMLCHMYPLSQDIDFLDATDALAAAVCHHLQSRIVVGGGSKFSDWKSFIANNEKRIIK